MRKTLLGLAVIAAGAVTCVAQSNVYSLNIVGYVNVPVKLGLSFISNPLDAGVTNGANEVIPNTGQWDGCEIQKWNGVGYSISVFDSATADTTSGFTDRNFNPIPAPTVGSGVGFFFNNLSAASNNITYVGNVRVGTNSTSMAVGKLAAVGSSLPLAGGVITGLGLDNTGGRLDGCEVQRATYRANGTIAGFSISVFDSATADTTTGFTDRNFNPVPEPSFAVGDGFFFNNLQSAAVTWTQVLLNQ